MLVELRQKSQVTIPKEFIVKFSLSEGDKFDVVEKDGMICMIPVAVYPKKYIEDLQTEVAMIKEQIAEGKQPIFDNLDDMFASLEDD